MKKMLCALVLVALIFAPVFAQGESEKKGDEVIKLTLALANPAADPWAQGLAKFADELKRLSGGTMEVDCYFGGQLYGASNLLSAIKAGKVDFAGYSMGSQPEVRKRLFVAHI